eukprot:TRINITY_DN25279_c0_g1_i1.p1 TRINITY_DN25279_c0_g1~~TRINITY_DN25279_c0_g1_i1.p1  ORF type:complete len:252 (+),score=57.12 TRINITY_DN25279_c0_g1_i1:37-792(+)
MATSVPMGRRSSRSRTQALPGICAAAAIVAGLRYASEFSPQSFVPMFIRGASDPVQRCGQVSRQFFSFGEEPKPKEPPVVIKEDYTLAAVFSAVGLLLCGALPNLGFGLGLLILLLGVLFFVQAGRVRFVFDDEAFELRTLGSGEGEELESPGENIVVGGKNRWAYSSFVNWEFFPKGLVEKGLPPILVYFKETQTPESEWSTGPGASANSPEALEKGAVPGMVHFFPAICDTQQIKAEFERRGCKKLQAE